MTEVLELDDVLAGQHISAACEAAVKKASEASQPVHFVFNDTHVTVHPGETAETAVARWNHDFEAAAKAWRESPEHAERERKREEENKRKLAEVMRDARQD